ANDLDCDDQNPDLHPGAPELCDGLDNDCNGVADDMPFFTYYADNDEDGYGDSIFALDTCLTATPAGYSINDLDCDDNNADINPDAQEIVDSLDNDCNGFVDDVSGTADLLLNNISIYPNPVQDRLLLHHPEIEALELIIFDVS